MNVQRQIGNKQWLCVMPVAWRSSWLLWLVLLSGFSGLVRAVDTPVPPPFMLANSYVEGVLVADYWVSEKYDGVRGYWDGKQLRSRSGRVISTPTWFTQGWPVEVMDGELWLGRERFDETSGLLRRKDGLSDPAWQAMQYRVFDMPQQAVVFDQRLRHLQHTITQLNQPWVIAVPQRRVQSHEDLHTLLLKWVGEGAEGVMLHHVDGHYRAGRSPYLLKYKVHHDMDADVIGYRPGAGQWQGFVGALVVRLDDGQELALGSGLTRALREHPPAIGARVTLRYTGLTSTGLPRFARFLRERPPQ